jgi:light-independent protochlorophyllide reductase subunit B
LPAAPASRKPPEQASCNILGPTSLGFRNRDDIVEVVRLVESLGIRINTVAPLGASPADLARIPQAHFNIVLYPEIADTAARWLKRQFGQEMVTTVPIGVGATRDFVTEVAKAAGVSSAARAV